MCCSANICSFLKKVYLDRIAVTDHSQEEIYRSSCECDVLDLFTSILKHFPRETADVFLPWIIHPNPSLYEGYGESGPLN